MKPKADQTLLGLCIVRAGQAHVRDELAAGRDPDRSPTRRETMRAMWSSTTTASKVAALIALWAIALDDLERDELGVEEFAAWGSESRMTVYRRLAEFRRLWPEYDTPNELAVLVRREARRRRRTPDVNVALRLSA